MHESPAEFAAQVKKTILLQLTKWETDRAAVEARASRAREEAVVAAKVMQLLLLDYATFALPGPCCLCLKEYRHVQVSRVLAGGWSMLSVISSTRLLFTLRLHFKRTSMAQVGGAVRSDA